MSDMQTEKALALRDPVIAKLDSARTALREATTLQQTKIILDVAAAAEVYAQRQKLGEDAIQYATGIKNEALMKWGALWKGEKKNEGTKGQPMAAGPGRGHKTGGFTPEPPVSEQPTTNPAPTLRSLGMPRKAAATAVKLATLAEQRPDIAKQLVDGKIKQTEALRQMRKDAVADKVKALPDGKYRVIYADPPWSYNDSREAEGARDSSAASDHYVTMTLKDICALDVKSRTAEDAVLFMWGTFPLLSEALQVINAWGFKYKTAFVWDKGAGAFGHYHNAAAELLFVATRGSAVPDSIKKEDQVIQHDRLGHSRKPECFREMIDRMYIHGPRIEMFRRGDAPSGWVVWGNEVEEPAA